jgi:hypothetical protein
MLRNRYYLGYVTYQGEEFRGRHQPLVAPELFTQVQDLMDARGGKGTRYRVHHHYLKGSLWCGQCHDAGREFRMIIARARGKGGEYFYFFCRGRQEHVCDSRYVDFAVLEASVLRHYAEVRFPADLADRVRQVVAETLEDTHRAEKLQHERIARELARLDTQEENLLDLAADGSLAAEKIKARLKAIKAQRERLQNEACEISERLAAGGAFIEAALSLLDDPQELYRQMGPEQRRLLNQAVFDKIYVIDENVTEATFNPPFDELMLARQAAHESGRKGLFLTSRPEPEGGTAGLLAAALFGRGSSKGLLVEVSGLEPPTSTLRTCLLRTSADYGEPSRQVSKLSTRRRTTANGGVRGMSAG